MILPPQKLSSVDKNKRDATTGKNNIEETADYYIDSCNWNKYTTEIFSLYNAVEGNINPDDYKQVSNPYNQKTQDGESPYNAVLNNFNILKTIANLLMGEFGRRTHEYNVTQINPSDEMAFKDGLNIIIRQYYAQEVANNLTEQGVNLGQQAQELQPLETYVQNFKDTFDDTRVITGQEILDYIKFNADLDNKYLDLYWDWIIIGGFCSVKGVNHDDVYFEHVPMHEVFIPHEKHSRYFEDASYAVRRQVLPIFKIVDFFRGRMPEELVTQLEEKANKGLHSQFSSVQLTGRNGAIQLPTVYASGFNQYEGTQDYEGVELFHVQYRTFKKYYILHYINELGFESTMDVGEDYKLNKEQGDIKLEAAWENQIYDVYKCLDVYLDAGELLTDRADLNQEGLQKLSYNGIRERSVTNSIQSLIKDGMPYQRSINVLKFQLEKLINKNKDKILVMPYGLINKKKGLTAKSTMYHADSTSVLWIDETAPNASFAAQMIKSVDMSLGNYIKDTIGFIQYIKSEYWESIGMNAQRMANVGENAGKAVTDQALVRSAIITYELTRQFDKVVEKDYTGLLDCSKLAYIKGKKAKYVRGENAKAFLNMNEDGAIYHSENSYNVFVRDASMMTEAINAMRGQAVNLIQNGGDTAILGHLWQTNNVTKLTKILAKMDENKKQYEALMQENKAKADQALQESVNANDELNREMQKYEADTKYNAVVDSARIRTENKDDDKNEARPANDVEIALAENKIRKDREDTEIKKEANKISKMKKVEKK